MIKLFFIFLLLFSLAINVFADYKPEQKANYRSRTNLKLLKETRRFHDRLNKSQQFFLRKINKAENNFRENLCKSQPLVADDVFLYDDLGNVQLRIALYKQQESFATLIKVSDWAQQGDSIAFVKIGSPPIENYAPNFINTENFKIGLTKVKNKRKYLADSTSKQFLINEVAKTMKLSLQMDCLEQFLRTRKEQLKYVSEKHRNLLRTYKRLSRNIYFLNASSNEWKEVYKEKINAILSQPENQEEMLAKRKGFPMQPLDSMGRLFKSSEEKSLALSKPNLNNSVESNISTSTLHSGQKTVNEELKDIHNGIPTEELIKTDNDLNNVKKVMNDDLQLVNVKLQDKESIVASSTNFIGQNKNVVKQFIQNDIDDLGANASNIIEKNMRGMHNEFSKLKSRYTNISNAADIPNSKVNPYRVKPLKKRIEWGYNAHLNHNQFWKATGMSLGMELGFLYSPRLTFGSGIDYSLGWTSRMQHLFDEGFNGRFYFDWQAYKRLYITASAIPPIRSITIMNDEAFNQTDQYDSNKWQLAAGLKWRLNKKGRKGPEMQLLYSINHSKMGRSALTYRVGWK